MCRQDKSEIKTYETVSSYPLIDPDYAQVVLPPNIAPINFRIQEKALRYHVEIYSNKEYIIKVSSESNEIQIPPAKWKKLLMQSRGKDIYIDIYINDSGTHWKKFRTISNSIANEQIDSHVVYRLINPVYELWSGMGIYQRNLENFDETPIFINRVTHKNCVNCHSFCNNDPKKMLFHMRAFYSGTMIIRNNIIKKVNTKTNYTMSAGVYPAWHPGGNHIAFSVNKINQKFHGSDGGGIYVYDRFSDLVIYNIEKDLITTSPKISTERLENLPHWSPDGKYLYFCSAPDPESIHIDTIYNKIKYDLMRISYNIRNNQWGEVEKILISAETGKSISFPRISPGGRFLLCNMSDYGYFTIHIKSSDLYLIDLKHSDYWKLDVNSESPEGYHSWSSNSRWFVFASKRRDGLCSRLYFSYLDENGKTSKPFLLPQKDPDFYDTLFQNYNVPEMVKEAVEVDSWQLTQTALGDPVNVNFDENVDIDALSGASKIKK